MTSRREILVGGASLAAAGGLAVSPVGAREGPFRVTRSDAEWQRLLSAEQYEVLRRSGTERAGSSPLDREKRPGFFACAGCGQALFRSAAKYDSGTGWPSFTAPIGGAVGKSRDTTFGVTRVAVHCSACGGHLGHVFDDGPRPAGKRYCMNGVALRFTPAA